MRFLGSFVLFASFLATASVAEAHVSLASGPAATGKTQKITFGVGHGCIVAGVHFDTAKIRVEIPTGISGVRPLASDFGKATVEKSGTDITAVTWTKDAETDDFLYYELTLRARVDATAFTSVLFTVVQTCHGTAGDIEVRWTQPPGADGDPAPVLVVAPPHVPGWNKLVIPAGVTVPLESLPTYLGDAQIVWRGTAAFSTNADTMAMIAATAGVTALAGPLVANDELWVKY